MLENRDELDVSDGSLNLTLPNVIAAKKQQNPQNNNGN